MSEHAPNFELTTQHHEAERMLAVKVSRISEGGLAFGSGEISGKDELDILDRVDEVIRTSPAIVLPIDCDKQGKTIDDDGCGDGRPVRTVFSFDKTYNKSLHRPKVFGGSVAMTAASLIGLGEAKGKSLNAVFDDAIDALNEHSFNFGAHTDEHASGKKCGCGAIDRAPEAVMASVRYKEPISNVISSLVENTDGLEEVFENFGSYVSKDLPEHIEYSGSKVMDRIIKESKVVKQLGGAHRERRIILNKVRGQTVNQGLIRETSEDKVQVFAVDVWRLEDIATHVFEGQAPQIQKALLSELVYTLAIAAVLTKGDLPVDMIEEAQAQSTDVVV